jgi:hypothetical protein
MRSNLMIQLAPGAEQVGLAVMLKDLIGQNLEQHPRKLADFKKLDIRIGLAVSDADIDLTLDFKAGDVMTIHAGIKGRPALSIDAEAEVILALSNQRIKWGLPYYFDETGREIMSAIRSGRLKIRGMIAHFPSLIRLSRVMSVH